MAVQRYSLYPASINGGSGGSGFDLTQVASVAMRSGRSISVVRPGGSLDPGANMLSSARPVAALATRDLDKVLANVSLTAGYYCAAASQFNFQQRAAGGAFTAGNSTAHVTQSVASGFLSISEISAEAESDLGAQCGLEFVCLSSDGTNPITDDDNAAINAQPTPAFSSAYFMGPAYLGSTFLEGLVRARVRPGINYQARITDGAVFPMAAASSIASRTPQIELTFLKLSMITANITNMIHAALAETLAVYFQKGSTGAGGRVSAASGAHVKISAAAGSWGADDVTVQQTDDATTTVMIQPTGTLALSTTSTIPS